MTTTIYKIEGTFDVDTMVNFEEGVTLQEYMHRLFDVTFDATCSEIGYLGFEITVLEEDAAFNIYDDIKAYNIQNIRLTEHRIEILAEDSDD